MFLGQYKLFFIAIFHTKMFTSPSPETQNKAPKNLPRHRSQNKKKEKRQEKAANLQRGYRTDQLPNHNSKTMSNKKLSKSNFHRHPLFSRSHLSPFWRIWRVQHVLYSSQRQRKEFHREKSARAQTLGSNNGILDTGEWTCNQWMWLIHSRILTKGFQTTKGEPTRCPFSTVNCCLLLVWVRDGHGTYSSGQKWASERSPGQRWGRTAQRKAAKLWIKTCTRARICKNKNKKPRLNPSELEVLALFATIAMVKQGGAGNWFFNQS